MDTFFNAEFFTNNRTNLQRRLKGSVPIVITGNGQMQCSGDEAFKFRQDNNFWYLTGLDGFDLTLVITQSETYLIVPILTFEREAFDGAHDVAAYTARSGIANILDAKTGWQKLRSELQQEQTVATLESPPSYMKRQGLYTLPYRRHLITKLKRLKPGIAVQDIRPDLATMRCVKQPEELRALQQAIDITTTSLQEIAAPDFLQSVEHEYQLEAALTYRFRNYGAEGHAFPPVIAAGANSTTLHHMDNDGPITPNDVIIVDIGASVSHYSADIARTISKQPISGRTADIFNAVAAAQDFAFSQIKPGILPLDYEKSVEGFIGEQLRKLGVIKGNNRADIRHYFPHATSHFLGLDTHDTGDYRAPWKENMVLACEPGIYLPEEGIGVRIEDNVLITKTGCKVLSSACPRTLTPVQ